MERLGTTAHDVNVFDDRGPAIKLAFWRAILHKPSAARNTFLLARNAAPVTTISELD